MGSRTHNLGLEFVMWGRRPEQALSSTAKGSREDLNGCLCSWWRLRDPFPRGLILRIQHGLNGVGISYRGMRVAWEVQGLWAVSEQDKMALFWGS